MDVESQATLDEAVNRAQAGLTTAGNELIDRLQTVGAALIDRALSQTGNIIRGVETSLADMEGKTVADVEQLVTSLDGWTLSITIPPIELKLHKPNK